MSEALLVGLGGDLEGQVADGELGLAKESSRGGILESADHLTEFVFDELAEFIGKLLGDDILLRGMRFRHGGRTDKGGGFLGQLPGSSLVYIVSTNFRDAHTCRADE